MSDAQPNGRWHWLRPPVFEDETQTQRARLLHWILGWAFGVCILLGPLISMAAGWRVEVVIAQVASLFTIALGLALLRRSVWAAGAFVSVVAFVLQTAVVLLNGVGASAVGGYMVIVVATGIFLDGRRALWSAILSCVAVVALAWAQTEGVMEMPPARQPMVVAMEASLQILLVLTLLGAGLRSLRISEDRARAEARRHARLVARSPDGVFELDSQGRVGAFNPAAERLTGRSSADVMGKRLWDLGLVGRDDAARARVHLERVWTKGGDSPFEIEVLNEGGESVPVEVFPRRVVRADGAVGLMATCRDLRARRRIENERANLEEMLQRSRHLESVGRLAGGVAHDFNNLLTIMLSNTQLLLDGDAPGPHWREDVEQVESAAKRASALTQQLLAFARRETLEPELTDINEPLKSLHELLARLCGDEVAVEMELGAAIPRARLDRTRFEQIVLNLAANARDAMPEGGTLKIRTAPFVVGPNTDDGARAMPAGPYVWLRVQDEGEGMDEHTVAHVFEPFFTTKRGRGGTGLGLATVHGIVAQSAGFVFVESSPGNGTAFDLFFPEAEGSADTTSGRWDQRKRQGPFRATILLVEDEPVSGRITTRVLEERGYEVLWAQGVGEAREIWAARAGDIRLLLSDVVMPDGMGPQLAKELTEQDPELCVVYISGFDDEALGDSLGAEASGLTLVRKPFSIDRLVDHVQAALEGEQRPTGRLERPDV